ncbi:MAG TPA: radical SAM family heme chaperone HemW [Chryseolinea sp.]|nr:radical SAM family heme chaperone HemW [Chryseolinea sp.]
MAGIYIHIPFCKQACHYCDFHFSTNLDKQSEMVVGLSAELALQRDYLQGEVVETIYLGGGTPSLLSLRELDSLFQSIHKNYPLHPKAEITLEANPDDLSKQKLHDMRSVGINRLSIGIQSFDDKVLASLHRVHNSHLAEKSIEDAYETGFENISIDLIYGIPGQDDELWKNNISRALAFKPQHISSYALTVEERTVFGKRAAQGKFTALDDDNTANQLQLLVEMLSEKNYAQYEVSNFCLPGFMSQHNSNYWKSKPYLGIGPSAHSYNGSSRQHNVRNNYQYLASIGSARVPAQIEILSREDKINEYLLTSLRTSWGADLNKLRNEFDVDIAATYKQYLKQLLTSELATVHEDTLVLTRKGKLLADKIASDLFLLPSQPAR